MCIRVKADLLRIWYSLRGLLSVGPQLYTGRIVGGPFLLQICHVQAAIYYRVTTSGTRESCNRMITHQHEYRTSENLIKIEGKSKENQVKSMTSACALDALPTAPDCSLLLRTEALALQEADSCLFSGCLDNEPVPSISEWSS